MEDHFKKPDENIQHAALKLLRFKMLMELEKDHGYSEPSLDIEDVNEVLTVANLPVIVPSEVNAPEVNVIQVKEDAECVHFTI